jgi:hypothetical protein
VVQHLPDSSEQVVLAPVSQVVAEFQDVFADLTSLPPHRQYDHAIPLLPNSALVISRPYCHSPLHKGEIERQVKQLLGTSLITTSTNPFA